MGVDLRPGGRCVRCATCDGFPCRLGAKSDAEVCAVDPALATGSARLATGVRVERLVTDASGRRVVEAVGVGPDGPVTVHGRRFVVSAGAANSAALLLASSSAEHPDGLGNSSGLLGRSFMMHNNAHIAAVDLNRHNDVVFQKTVMVTDWYHDGGDGHPLGTVQAIGKVQGVMMKSWATRVPLRAARRDRPALGRVGGDGRGPARPGQPGHPRRRAGGSAPRGWRRTPASTRGCWPGPSG